jgi:hypothetical protein
MKPLPVATFTEEDHAIFVAATLKRTLRWGLWINQRSIGQDRRDALVMLEAQSFHPLARNFGRILYTDISYGDCWIHCGGKARL